MPITAADLKLYESSNGNLGGAKGVSEVTLATAWDDVLAAESLSGDVEYRCFYVQNDHGTLALQDPEVYLAGQSPSPDTVFALAIEPGGMSQTAQSIANESTAPSGVVWQSAQGIENGIELPEDMDPGDYHAIWLRRTVSANAGEFVNDQCVPALQGQTAP